MNKRTLFLYKKPTYLLRKLKTPTLHPPPDEIIGLVEALVATPPVDIRLRDIGEFVKAGGFGYVFPAHWYGSGEEQQQTTKVALKIVPLTKSDEVRGFLKEVELSQDMRDPPLGVGPPLFFTGVLRCTSDTSSYYWGLIVMRFFSGGNLSKGGDR